nr:hypothetical protein [Tanacetum cinerariifolium]
MNGWLVEEDDEEEKVDEMRMMLRLFTPMRRLIPSTDHLLIRIKRSGPLGCNMEVLRSKVKTLDKQMYDRVREHLPNEMRYQEVLYDPATNPDLRIRPDDPYMIDRDATTTSARDDGDDHNASRDPQPSDPRGSPRDSQ